MAYQTQQQQTTHDFTLYTIKFINSFSLKTRTDVPVLNFTNNHRPKGKIMVGH